jgi:hypothetical protein
MNNEYYYEVLVCLNDFYPSPMTKDYLLTRVRRVIREVREPDLDACLHFGVSDGVIEAVEYGSGEAYTLTAKGVRQIAKPVKS